MESHLTVPSMLFFYILCLLNWNNSRVLEALAEPTQQTKKLPVGVRNIREILEGDYIYVDKTGLIYDLMLEHNFDYFMVRPKGFGKTLFLSTLEEIFKGSKELFKGTAIYRSKYKWLKFPVLHFDFSRVNCRDPDAFEATLKREVRKKYKTYDIAPAKEEDNLKVQMKQLVEELSKKSGTRVVILVDEYDAPIANSAVDKNTAEKCRNITSNFLAIVASLSDNFLQFTFVTGVNQFSVCGDQGYGDDHLVDITLNPRYAALMGFTKEELEINFAEYVSTNGTYIPARENVLAKAQEQCDNYRFTQNEICVYNPLEILTRLNAAENAEIDSSFHDKIPSFLIDSVRKDPRMILNLQRSISKGFSLQSPVDISKQIDLEQFLFRIGYLTIRGYHVSDDSGYYELDFQSENVKNIFFRTILEGLTKLDPNEIAQESKKMKQNLVDVNVDSFMATLYTHISRIPIDELVGQNVTLEYYRAIFHLLMENYGFEMNVELDYSSRTEISDIVIVFKFTLNLTAEIALKRVMETQIVEKSKKMLYAGVNFNVETRNIDNWKATLIDGGQVVQSFPSNPK